MNRNVHDLLSTLLTSINEFFYCFCFLKNTELLYDTKQLNKWVIKWIKCELLSYILWKSGGTDLLARSWSGCGRVTCCDGIDTQLTPAHSTGAWLLPNPHGHPNGVLVFLEAYHGVNLEEQMLPRTMSHNPAIYTHLRPNTIDPTTTQAGVASATQWSTDSTITIILKRNIISKK